MYIYIYTNVYIYVSIVDWESLQVFFNGIRFHGGRKGPHSQFFFFSVPTVPTFVYLFCSCSKNKRHSCSMTRIFIDSVQLVIWPAAARCQLFIIINFSIRISIGVQSSRPFRISGGVIFLGSRWLMGAPCAAQALRNRWVYGGYRICGGSWSWYSCSSWSLQH